MLEEHAELSPFNKQCNMTLWFYPQGDGGPRRRELALRNGGAWAAILSHLHQRKVTTHHRLSKQGPDSPSPCVSDPDDLISFISKMMVAKPAIPMGLATTLKLGDPPEQHAKGQRYWGEKMHLSWAVLNTSSQEHFWQLAARERPTEGLHPSSGLPGVSPKLPAQRAPHGRELGVQQAEEEVSSLRSALLCLESPSKRQRMDLCTDLLSHNEMVMGGSPERFSTQPPVDAVHKEGSCSSNLPAFSSPHFLWRPRTPSATPRSCHCLREPSALRLSC